MLRTCVFDGLIFWSDPIDPVLNSKVVGEIYSFRMLRTGRAGNAAGRLQAEESEFRNPDMLVVMLLSILMVTAFAMAGLVQPAYDHDAMASRSI